MRGGDKKRLGEYVGRFVSKCYFFLAAFLKEAGMPQNWVNGLVPEMNSATYVVCYFLFFLPNAKSCLMDTCSKFGCFIHYLTKKDFYPCSRKNWYTQNNIVLLLV